MVTFILRHLVASTLVAALALSVSVQAQEEQENKSAGAVVTDALFVRPMMLIRTAVGLGTFIATLPFTVPGGNIEAAAEALFLQPARETFLRPLGGQKK